MRVIKRISAVIIGIVFFVAGILKLMDPVGAGLVVESYLKFMGLGFLRQVADIIGVCFALTETFTGAALLTGIRRKITAMLSGVLIAGFTILTAFLWALNPEMDCGCFGEAMHLTHFQSFAKNVLLCVLWAVAFLPLRSQEPTRKIKYATFTVVFISVALFFLYSSLSIPMVDFTNYKPGAEMMLAEEIDAEDTETPSLSFSGADGEYADSLALDGNVMAITVWNAAKVSERKWQKIGDFVNDAANAGYTPIVLAASTPDEIGETVSNQDVLSSIYFADRKDLMTMNRSNGGATFIADGQIVAKWSVNALPKRAKLAALNKANATEVLVEENSNPRLKLQAFLLFVMGVMLLI